MPSHPLSSSSKCQASVLMPLWKLLWHAISEALRAHLRGTHSYALHCPRAAPSAGVVSCTYHHWFKPFSQRRRYCQLPVSGRRMQRFLQFRLGSHNLPIVAGRFQGTNMLQGLIVYAHTVTDTQWLTRTVTVVALLLLFRH